MEFKYTVTEQDYLNFNLYHIQNSKTAVQAIKVQRVLVPLLYLGVAYIFAKLTNGSLMIWMSIFLVLGILWFIFYPKYYYHHVLRQVRKMLKEGKNEGLLGDYTMSLSEDGIHEITSKGEMKSDWSSIQKFAEDDHSLYLYNTSLSAYIIPKREIENIEELRSYIQSKQNHFTG